MSEKKQLWVLAGGNGAGKSTFYHTQLEKRGMPFVNADLIAKEIFPDAPEENSYQAAMIAENLRNEFLEDGISFCFESVFSHPSKIDFLGKAKSQGYEIILVVIHLSSTALNKARISQRIEEGGHAVPEDKVESRIPRTMENMRTALMICDQTYLIDNSDSDNPFEVVAKIIGNEIELKQETLPDWATFIITPQ